MAHPNRLLNARILALGGTSGIGFGIASFALSQGARVIISGSKQPKVDDKVRELQSLYPNLPTESISGYACDLSDIENMEKNVKELLDKATDNGTKNLDHITHTAGDMFALPTLANLTVSSVLAGFNVRFLTGAILAKHIATGNYMDFSAKSSLTLTSGTNSHKPAPGWSIGSPWGTVVEGLVRGLAVDLKPIRVNCVAPGAIDTPMLQSFLRKASEEDAKRFRGEGNLVGDYGSVVDCAEAFGWSMRDRNVTGVTIRTDGGRILV
ncbi:NAD(P)-binding protein [Massarina eburnea CBS 473.64]|uniref:NAD(P)-binding protein n=1 Tax=Massarina eburnea CBS 473.64 TaxID=1395130 RepID=A0A6A6RQ45_9PLEO|nr:NAD(P)-binding protein [Massarina eburnea CBS 473.64]